MRTRTHTHTRTHMHIYIYIYIPERVGDFGENDDEPGEERERGENSGRDRHGQDDVSRRARDDEAEGGADHAHENHSASVPKRYTFIDETKNKFWMSMMERFIDGMI